MCPDSTAPAPVPLAPARFQDRHQPPPSAPRLAPDPAIPTAPEPIATGACYVQRARERGDLAFGLRCYAPVDLSGDIVEVPGYVTGWNTRGTSIRVTAFFDGWSESQWVARGSVSPCWSSMRGKWMNADRRRQVSYGLSTPVSELTSNMTPAPAAAPVFAEVAS